MACLSGMDDDIADVRRFGYRGTGQEKMQLVRV